VQVLSSGSECFLSAVSPGLVLGTTGKPGGKAGGTCEEFEDNELMFLTKVIVDKEPLNVYCCCCVKTGKLGKC